MPLILETNVAPPVVLYDETTDARGSSLAAWIRPRITGSLPLIGAIDYAPYGTPTPGLGGVVLIVGLMLMALGAVSLVRRR
jgi:hypothetical protein